MAASFVHVVGWYGVGKSTLIQALAAQYKAQGQVCAGDGEPFIFNTRADALREQPGADVYFIEHVDMRRVDALPGERVIQIGVVPEPGAWSLKGPDGATVRG